MKLLIESWKKYLKEGWPEEGWEDQPRSEEAQITAAQVTGRGRQQVWAKTSTGPRPIFNPPYWGRESQPHDIVNAYIDMFAALRYDSLIEESGWGSPRFANGESMFRFGAEREDPSSGVRALAWNTPGGVDNHRRNVRQREIEKRDKLKIELAGVSDEELANHRVSVIYVAGSPDFQGGYLNEFKPAEPAAYASTLGELFKSTRRKEGSTIKEWYFGKEEVPAEEEATTGDLVEDRKLLKQQLKQLIKEEISKEINEAVMRGRPQPPRDPDDPYTAVGWRSEPARGGEGEPDPDIIQAYRTAYENMQPAEFTDYLKGRRTLRLVDQEAKAMNAATLAALKKLPAEVHAAAGANWPPSPAGHGTGWREE